MFDFLNKKTNRREVSCVIPYPQKGGGGIRTVFNNLTELKKECGYCIDIYIIPFDGMETDTHHLGENIKEWFAADFDNIYIESSLKEGYEVAIATSWNSVSLVEESNAKCKCYFIQDLESMFYPTGFENLMAEETYKKNLHHITFGRWLGNKINEISNKPSLCYDFCADKNIYKQTFTKKERAICAIWQPEKPRRLSEFLINIIELIVEQDPTIEIYLYGSEKKANIIYPQVCQLGLITPEECNDLYNRCLCGISLSASNPSRIPFEMMSSGLPVVELYRENNICDFPEEAMLLVENTPEAFAETVCKLVNDKNLMSEMSSSGIEYMKNRSIEFEKKEFVKCIKKCMNGEDYVTYIPNKEIYKKQPEQAGDYLKALSKTINNIKREEIIKNSIPLRGNSILIECQLPLKARLNKDERASIAIWKNEDQSDLVWLDMAINDGKIISGRWVNSCESKETETYNFHLYKHGEKSELLAYWKQRVIPHTYRKREEKSILHNEIKIIMISGK